MMTVMKDGEKENAPDIPKEFLSPYKADEYENEINALWDESGFFAPENLPGERKEKFSMVLPPPNVTGVLHMGHAMTIAIEDALVRFERMRGKKTLWLPGTDHAAIATQSRVEKDLVKKEKKNRHDIGREEFLRRVEEFARNSHDTIVAQTKRMGASLDWTREAFTLDETRRRAVTEAFVSLYDMGLVYRKERVVNWDPKGQTTVSDDEVEHETRPGKLYTFRYTKDFPIPVATTRPETKLGDTAVAVHPDDPRYKKYIGKEFSFTFMGAPVSLRIVGDEAVDPDFGTGAVGVTPAHSKTDEEIALRHNLPFVRVINEYARMEIGDEGIKGEKVSAARERIVERLRAEGLLEREENIEQNIAVADRSGGVIEPLPKMQWFIAVDKEFEMRHSRIEGIQTGEKTTLKKLMRHVVEKRFIRITPDRFEKTYFHWIDNLHDWCISRQIWYGHRIPAWHRGEEIYVGKSAPEGEGWEQDPDTLDTWFSSGLWTFSTLGWPDETEDFRTYHPTDVLETGYDILFFWIARMILMTTALVGDIPFRRAYLHGIVRDAKGRKMSKSIGNIIDPLDMIAKYGTDAVRMSLLVGNPPGNDTNLSEDKIRGYKYFTNKIWNIARFIVTARESARPLPRPDKTPESDTSLRAEIEDLAREITSDIENFRLHLAAEKLHHYAWHRLADEIIEESKSVLAERNASSGARADTLADILRTLLLLLHPFAPFVTEKIWRLSFAEGSRDLLLVADWPVSYNEE